MRPEQASPQQYAASPQPYEEQREPYPCRGVCHRYVAVIDQNPVTHPADCGSQVRCGWRQSISMVAVISNVKQLTAELERLLDESREGLDEAMRFYGIYVLLVLAVDRLEKHFVKKVDEEFSPQLKQIAAEARQIIADARGQISKGGPVEVLSSNIETNNSTIKGCQLFADILESQRRAIVARNCETQRVLGAAVNTYRTVRSRQTFARSLVNVKPLSKRCASSVSLH